ncbi:HNH endonuclease [Sinorhizobium fredii]|uniref:HNH endonuclease n=1 Tax=Rhizobium fredii TaxID=380 RepID=UPI0009B6E1BF|nr:HNH endonuclease signature motif containing protein [Sinorhizobium fredii]
MSPNRSRYAALGDFLLAQNSNEFVMTLVEIEKLVGSLPSEARTSQFWANAKGYHQARRNQWLKAGYKAYFLPQNDAVRFVLSTDDALPARTNWTSDELRACVDAYHQLWLAERQGVHIDKSRLRREVLEKALSNRRDGAYEYRMQNISAVLDELGMEPVTGYLPRRNVGRHKVQLIQLINEFWERLSKPELPTSDPQSLETRIASAKARNRQGSPPPGGSKEPLRVRREVFSFERDPEVVAWVLSAADGVCEICDLPAPFVRSDGAPYLEVHHVRTLAEGGPDQCDNAVAVCPNCHRRLHHGDRRDRLRHIVVQKVARLRNYPALSRVNGSDEAVLE